MQKGGVSIKRSKIVFIISIVLLAILATSCTFVFRKIYYKVEFYVQGELVSTQSVLMNRAATAPDDPVIEGYIFLGWDQEFKYVTKNMQIHAILVKEHLTDIEKLEMDLDVLKQKLENKSLNSIKVLPTVGERYQSTIDWVSPTTNITIDSEGNLRVIEESTNIKLYVILSLNDSVIYYEFVFK